MGNSDLVRAGTSETNDRVGFLSVIFYPGKDRFSYIVVGDLGRNAFRMLEYSPRKLFTSALSITAPCLIITALLLLAFWNIQSLNFFGGLVMFMSSAPHLVM